MGGSCSMPLAAHAHFDGGRLCLRAAWGDVENPGVLVRAEGSAAVTTLAEATALGEAVVAQLRANGAH